MRILTSAALAISTALAATAFTMPAQAGDRHERGDRYERGHHHHHGDRHRHRHGGLKIGIDEDGLYLAKKRRHHHHHHRRHHRYD